VKGKGQNLPWVVALGLRIVGEENADRLVEELEAAVSAQYHKWQKNELRLVQERPQIKESLGGPSDVASFIFDHFLPLVIDRSRRDIPRGKHKILNLVTALEPDQFVGLVIVYADRIGDRDGVTRAFDILRTSSSVHRQQLKTYRKSSEGGHIAANPLKGKRAAERAARATRDQQIHEQAAEWRNSGKPKHMIAGKLAKKHGLSTDRIRKILKKSNP
jgi:hypothetical protein